MSKRKVWFAVLFLLLVALVPAVYATQPTEVNGFFWFPEDGPYYYCMSTGDNYTPDGFMVGCVIQPEKPGLAQKGVMDMTVGELNGSCTYSLRTYEIDGIARFVTTGCDGDLVGLHFKGVGWAHNGLWEGSYHFDP